MHPFHVIIPARYESSRLPGKPLRDIAGKPMLQHVVERALLSGARTVCVATDDVRVETLAQQAGAIAVMTSRHHPSGTDRVAEATISLQLEEDDIVVNVQGDEPDMPPSLIRQVSQLLAEKKLAVMATASAPLEHGDQLQDPSVVKVVTDREGYAMYFSRATIPWVRRDDSSVLADHAAEVVRRHLGIYAYRCSYVRQFAGRDVCPLERWEKLEQLRVLWHGEKIACAEAVEVPGAGVDTEEDLQRAQRRLAASPV
jgi:3-deoxy-manno-octulosonate cytidylyltransferase (CMP-KDO synthetase)